MQLRKLHINDYKMFKNFDMSFVDKDDNPLPIIVLAGVNGSGKTTLLEYIYDCTLEDESFIKIEVSKKPESIDEFTQDDIPEYIKEKRGLYKLNYLEYKDIYKQNIIYLPVYENSILDLKESILEHYRRLSRNYSHSEALKNIQDFLDNIFIDDMNITFTIEDIDIVYRDNEKVIFKNKSGDNFEIEELSTGEKTLLSKILYLHFKAYKGKVILIDEPELSLHPRWQSQVLKLYEDFATENNCQIIIATHSPHIIGSAKNEYLRILTKNGVIDDVLAYGRDIEWVLEKVMGTKSTRQESVSKKIKECQELLNDDKYDEAEASLDTLEKVIGENDSEIMAMRNSLEFWRE